MAKKPTNYLVVDDSADPTTWHLQYRDDSGNIDHRLCGLALAALHGGLPLIEGPKKEVALSKLQKIYKDRAWPFVTFGAGTTLSKDDLSYDEIRRLLEAALASKSPDSALWVRDVYDDRLVYSDYMTSSLWSCTYSIDGDYGVTFGDPEQVLEHALYEPVKMALFTVTTREVGTDGKVRRRGKIFQAGDYPTKKFKITNEEMMTAILEFQAVPIDVEHRPSMLDGHLGELEHVDVDPLNPADMIGTIAIPLWLDEIAGENGITVSTSWDPGTKRLTGKLALAIDPQVTDALMLSRFNNNVPPVKEERKEKPKMTNWLQRLRGITDEMTPEEKTEFAAGLTNTPTGTLLKMESGPSAREIELEAKLAQFTRDTNVATATTFVDGLIANTSEGRRILPALRGEAIAMLARDMDDDLANAQVVTFSKADKTTATLSRAELTKAFLRGLPQHALFSDHTSASDFLKDALILPNTADMTANQREDAEVKAEATEFANRQNRNTNGKH